VPVRFMRRRGDRCVDVFQHDIRVPSEPVTRTLDLDSHHLVQSTVRQCVTTAANWLTSHRKHTSIGSTAFNGRVLTIDDGAEGRSVRADLPRHDRHQLAPREKDPEK